LGTLVDLSRMDDEEEGKTGPTDAQFAEYLCGGSFSRCAKATKAVKVAVKLKNLKWAWYSANAENKKKADDAMKNDMALAAGVSPTAVTVTATELPATTGVSGFHTLAAASGVQYETVISTDSNADADAPQTALNAQATAGTLSLSTIATEIPTAAKVSAADGIVVSGTSVTTTAAPGSASTIGVSIFSIISVFIALLMMRA